MTVIILALGATLLAETAGATAQRRDAAPARLRVTVAKTTLLDACTASGAVKGTLQRGDELEVVRPVDADWYRVRLPRSGGAEGCVAASDVEPTSRPSGTAWEAPRDGGRRGGTGPSGADSGPGQRRRDNAGTGAAPERVLGLSGFFSVGTTAFSASDSFDAILDTSSGTFYGGGAQVRLPYHLFARVDITRFQKDGERAFVSNGQVFKLGIPTTITMTPIEFTGGYMRELRFGQRGPRPPRGGGGGGGGRGSSAARAGSQGQGFRLIPFVGGGVGVLRYEETADFAEAGDDVDESFTSYHVIGGVEVPVWRWIRVGAEYQHRWVPDAIGDAGVSAAFGETDLGGNIFRFRVIVGF